MTAALEGCEWSASRPDRTLPTGRTRYPLYRRVGGPQDRSGRAENLVPTRTRSRTVQPVAQSLYRLSYRAQITRCNIHNFYMVLTLRSSVLYGSQNRQRLWSYILLAGWFCVIVVGSVFSAVRTDSLYKQITFGL